jgi:predicted DNA-binding transcriptional regulator AlpA
LSYLALKKEDVMQNRTHQVIDSNRSKDALLELPKLAYSINQAAEAVGLSRAFIYAEWQAGRGPQKLKAGKRTLISDESLRSWLRSLATKSAPETQ